MRFLLLLLFLILLPFVTFAGDAKILFDQGHRQAFLIEKDGPLQLSQLATVFHANGWKVAKTTEPLTDATLAEYDALIISGAFRPLHPEEITAVLRYLSRGGKLAVMIHIGQPVLPLLHQLGVDVANRVINERQHQLSDKSIDFLVTNLQPHALTRNLKSFAIYGGWPLRVLSKNGSVLARTSQQSWADMDSDKILTEADIVSPFDVMISGDYGRGSFAVFADDAIFQNQFLKNGNKALAENLSKWLKTEIRGEIQI